LGQIANDPKGTCFEGYEGILCSKCKKGFSQTGYFECSKCPKKWANALRLSFILLAAVAGSAYMIRSTINGATQKRNASSIYNKILMNHF